MLSLLHNAVVGWNIHQMGLLIEQLRQEGHTIPDEDIQRVAPLMWRHINPFGQYHFDLTRMRRDSLTRFFSQLCLPPPAGHFTPAQALLEQGKQIWQAARHARWTANFNARLARVACHQERFKDALLLAEQSLAGYAHAPAPLGQAYAHLCRAHALCGLRQSEAATDALARTLEIWGRAGYRKGIVECLELAASLAVKQRDWQTGAKRLARAETIRAQMGVPLPPVEEETHMQMRNFIRAHKNWKVAWTAGEQGDTATLLMPFAANAPRPPTQSL